MLTNPRKYAWAVFQLQNMAENRQLTVNENETFDRMGAQNHYFHQLSEVISHISTAKTNPAFSLVQNGYEIHFLSVIAYLTSIISAKIHRIIVVYISIAYRLFFFFPFRLFSGTARHNNNQKYLTCSRSENAPRLTWKSKCKEIIRGKHE